MRVWGGINNPMNIIIGMNLSFCFYAFEQWPVNSVFRILVRNIFQFLFVFS